MYDRRYKRKKLKRKETTNLREKEEGIKKK